ncbi:helix-turn-helix domain-containing protein [Streptomyces sp. NPDC049906]|uniref:ATP-binding protein n=1 Tax=Streptomyces sp. NPDC049906 TaxID=3155656 RepID=UPI0034151F9D
MSTTPDGFGPRLRALRLAAGLSQEQLAHAAGVSVRALTYMERGRTRGPQRRTVEALAEALGLNEDDARSLETAAAPGRRRARTAVHPVSSGFLPLPWDVGDFTARGSALEALEALVEGPPPARPPVAVVTGTPGLGKTTFAVHAAHRLADRFPDGQFHLDLRAMDPHPVRPDDALARLLRELGVAEVSLPGSLEDRVGLLRSLTANRRLLLVLDNAADEKQVRPLILGSGTSLTLITSRNSLNGLEAVHRVELPLLRREESVELLARIIGRERVAREAQAARDLADRCGRLPLALRITGQRLAARPQESLSRLADLLGREERRLDLLRAGDLTVRAAFTLSYQQLDGVSRRLLRRCALATGPDTSPEVAALLAGVPLRDAELRLEELCDHGLLLADPSVERYRFHDLLALFTAERVAAEDDPVAREAAVSRTARWMLARATAAALHFDAEHHGPPTGDPEPATAPTGRDRARAWLEAERAQWLAAFHHAGAAGWNRQVLDAAEAMHWFSDLTHHWPQWADVFRQAAEAARALGSLREEATHLNYLAWAHNSCTHRPEAGLEAADAALVAARACDDRIQIGWALGYGARALSRLGRTDEAIARLRASADCLRHDASPPGRLALMTSLNALGEALRQHGRADEALPHHLHSLELCRQDHPGIVPQMLSLYEAVTLRHLGNSYAALDRSREAETSLRQALTGFEEHDMPGATGLTQLELGRVLRDLDRPDEARTVLAAALHTLTTHHHPLQAGAADELRSLTTNPVDAPGTPLGRAGG